MAESHVVSGLAARRAELTGQIQHYHTLIARLTADVAHLDATIKQFAPEFDLRTLRPKAYRARVSIFRHGDALVQVLNVMREAGDPITSSQIAQTLLAKIGDGSVGQDYNCAAKHVNNALHRLRKNGLVEVAPAPGDAFNPEHHNAVSQVAEDGFPPGSVVRTFQKGYLLNDRLLRPAMVVVAP